MQLFPLSDSSVMVRLGSRIDPMLNQSVHLLAAELAGSPFPGFIETIPSYASLVVIYDPTIQDYAAVSGWISAQFDRLNDAIRMVPKDIIIPVRYGGEFGEDLEFVARHCKMDVMDVIRLHSAYEYRVYMMGFTPGFAYLGVLHDSLITPRLATPRVHVRAGSVAIAGSQTAVYPIDSPGGWRVIGHTSVLPFDPDRDQPFLFAPGDTIRFIQE